MRAAIVSARVAAVVSASTATAATLVVTSKNIKNGTIQPIDLSAKTTRDARNGRACGASKPSKAAMNLRRLHLVLGGSVSDL